MKKSTVEALRHDSTKSVNYRMAAGAVSGHIVNGSVDIESAVISLNIPDSEARTYIGNVIEDAENIEWSESQAASVLGRKGGSVKSEAKTKANRENAKKGGRPRSKIMLVYKKMGKKTAVTKNEFGELDYQGAADRLVSRVYPGHFAQRAVGWDNLPDEFQAEICRAVGGMTEHVEKIWLEILRP